MALAADENRILITFDVADFPRIVQRWAAEGRRHAGCAIVVGIDHREFGTIIDVVTRGVAARPDQESWQDYACFLARRS